MLKHGWCVWKLKPNKEKKKCAICNEWIHEKEIPQKNVKVCRFQKK